MSAGAPRPPLTGRLDAARQGVVATFDEAAGLGTVREAGGASYPFHCTAIADGTRTIDVGTAVLFHLAAAGRGEIEATALVAVASCP